MATELATNANGIKRIEMNFSVNSEKERKKNLRRIQNKQ